MCCFKKNNYGFTLIEVLVVASIIALMATAAMYYVNSSREKARLAGALQFSGNLKTSMSINLVSYWPLDAVNSNVTPDIWSKNNGTLVSGPALVSGVFDKALKFNGSNYVKYIGGVDIKGNKITLSAWINHDGTGNYYKNIVARGDTDYGIALDQNKRPFFEINTGAGGRWLPFGKSLKANYWYYVVGVYDGSRMNMYVDGILQKPGVNNIWSGNITSAGGVRDTTIGAGSIGGGTQYFNGLIDEVQIYDSALTAQEIRKHYVEGAKKFDLAIK